MLSAWSACDFPSPRIPGAQLTRRWRVAEFGAYALVAPSSRGRHAVAWWLRPPANALGVGGVRPIQVDRVRKGARDGHIQARKFLFDCRAVLGPDRITQFFKHGPHAAHDLDRCGTVFADFGQAEHEIFLPASSRNHYGSLPGVVRAPSRPGEVSR